MRYLVMIWAMFFVSNFARAQSYSTGVPLPPQNISVTVSSAVVTQGTNPWIVSITPNANGSMTTTSVAVTESSMSAPANAVGVILEGESGNATNIRWGISNSGTSILSSTVGVLMEPGRDTGYVPAGSGSVLHLISVGAGTNKAGVQWILSQ